MWFVDPWWRPNSDGDDWKDDELKAQEAHALLRERLRHILRIVPRDALYKWRLSADSE